MSRGENRLTDRQVMAADKVPGFADPRRSKLYADGKGLWLQVTAAGTRSWLFRFTIAGKAGSMGLGDVATVPLAKAREMARQCRQDILAGIDPKVARDQRRAENRAAQFAYAGRKTFAEVAEEFIASKEKGWSDRHEGDNWRAMFKTHAPRVMSMPVDAIDVKAVLRVLEPIWSTRYKLAKKLQGRIAAVLAAATVRGLRTGDNPAAWRGHLQHAGLAAPAAVKTVNAHAAMPYADVPAFVAELQGHDHVASLAHEFLILTGCRAGEVVQTERNAGMQWPEVDFDSRTWTIPASRMKSRAQHRVPLSDRAIAILRQVEPLRQGDRVFPIGYWGLKGRFEKQRPGFDLHGFRSSFRDWCAVHRIDRDVAEAALAHYEGNATVKAYLRDDLLELRRPVMERWASYCAGETAPDNVRQLRRAAG